MSEKTRTTLNEMNFFSGTSVNGKPIYINIIRLPWLFEIMGNNEQNRKTSTIDDKRVAIFLAVVLSLES